MIPRSPSGYPDVAETKQLSLDCSSWSVMARFQVVCKRKVDYCPAPIEFDLQFLCSEASTADCKLVEIIRDGQQGRKEKRKWTGQVHREILAIKKLVPNDGAAIDRLDATRRTQVLNDVGQRRGSGGNEGNIILVNDLVITDPSPREGASLHEDCEKTQWNQDAPPPHRYGWLVPKRPEL